MVVGQSRREYSEEKLDRTPWLHYRIFVRFSRDFDNDRIICENSYFFVHACVTFANDLIITRARYMYIAYPGAPYLHFS